MSAVKTGQKLQNLGDWGLEVVKLHADHVFFSQKLNLDYVERHRKPRKLSTHMSYLADHTRCRGRADKIMT